MAVLAVNGGKKLRTKEFPNGHIYNDDDRKNILKIYDSGKYGYGGEQTQTLKKNMAAFSGVKYCIPVANGTVSIELILRGLGIGRGDEVIVPPYTFIASVSALIYAGVTPVFADIDPETCNLSPESAEKCITPRTKAIMPVYVGGRPAYIFGFEKICKKYGIYLIGDAAQAIGSEYGGKGIGNYGVATSVSCQDSKNLASGEGGLILTNDDKLYESVTCMLCGGRGKDGNVSALALNSGMSEFQAGILNTQLKLLPEQIARREENAAYLDKALEKFDFIRPMRNDPNITRNSYHLYLMRIDEKKLGGVTRDRFLEALESEGIPLTPGYVPAYDFPCISGGYTENQLGGKVNVKPNTPEAEYLARHEICWLYHAVLLGEKRDMDDIVAALEKVYGSLDELKGD